MARDRVDGKSKEPDIKDPEMIVVDQNETIDDLEESNTKGDTEVKTKRPSRDKERRFRDSSEEESSAESDSEQEDEKPKLSASVLSEKSDDKIFVGKSKKKISSRTRSPEEKNGKHRVKDYDKRSSSNNSSTSDCDSTPVRKSKGIAKKELKKRTKKTDKSGRKDSSSRYQGTDSLQKRGRSKDRRLRDSSRSSSSSWSGEKIPVAKTSNKGEVRIELEGGVPRRGYQVKKLKQNEPDKNTGQGTSKKQIRDLSYNSSSSEAHSNFRGNRKTNLDLKLELRKDDNKYAKSENPGLRTFRQKSRSPSQKHKWHSSERIISTSSDSDSDDSEVSPTKKSKEKRREQHREKEHGKLRTVKSKTRRQIAGKSYSSENSSSASEYVEKLSHEKDMLSKEVSVKDKQNSSVSYQKRSETSKVESIQTKRDKESRKRTDSSGSRSNSSEGSVDVTFAPGTIRKDDEVTDKIGAPVSVKSEIKIKEKESKSLIEKDDDLPKETVQRLKQPGRDHSRSRSRTKSPESSPGGYGLKDPSKPELLYCPLSVVKSGINLQEEHELKSDINEKTLREKDRKTTTTRDSSNSSSSTVASKRMTSKRSKIRSSVKKIAKRFFQDRSISKKGSSRSRDPRSKISHQSREIQRRRPKKQDSSASSSSSSSSSRSQSNSSSGSSDSSSSSSSNKSSTKSSLSEDQSSSSSSSSSSSTVKRFKHTTKNKERVKNRSRSPLVRRRRSKSPRSKKIHVGRLSRNINKEHLYEIFGLYGTVKNIDLPVDRMHGHMPRGFAYVEFETTEDADRALVHMNGGILDGQKISVAPVLLYKPRPMPVRRMSPIRRPFKPWRPTPLYRNRGGADRRRPLRTPFRRRSPGRRSRSRSNRRRRVRRGSNGSSR